MADPGLPEAVARSVVSLVNRDLNQLTQADSVEWSVEVSRDTLPLTEQNEIHLLDRAPGLRDAHGWDYMVYLTDLPRSLDNNSLVCEVDVTGNATLLSLPALGAVHVKSRARRVLTELVIAMAEESPGKYTTGYPRGFSRRNWQKVQREGDEENYEIILRGAFSRPRLLAGMVRSNRPMRLLPALSSSAATAVATGGFGIFYASIWNMSDALSTPRMAAISVFVVAAFATWLIVHNGLWVSSESAGGRIRSGLDNAATVLTVGIGVASMYLVLWAILFAVTLAVVNAEYLAGDIGHPVNLLDYQDIAWLASALGMMGGAMGSNFDKESDIREATYTRREYTRRKMAEREENQD